MYIPPQKREMYSPHRFILFSQHPVGHNLNDQISNFVNQIREPKIEANVTPLSKEIFDQLEFGNFESANTKLIIADDSIQSPLGILKIVIFKNEKIKIPPRFFCCT